MGIVNMHKAVELLLARMESNPEEFVDALTGRWSDILRTLEISSCKEDWRLIQTKLDEIRMDAAHTELMQELCAPPHPVQGELWPKAIPTPRNFTPHPPYELRAQGVQVKNGTCTVGPIEGEDSGE